MRKPATRRKRPTKKKNNFKPLIFGGLAIAGGWALWNYVIKPMTTPKMDDTPPGDENLDTDLPPGTEVIDAANNAPVNTVVTLSPKGTPDAKLKYDLILKPGDRGGEIEKLQKILNAISNFYGTYKIGVDGIYGDQTKKKLFNVTGKTYITLNQALTKYRAVEAAYGKKKSNGVDTTNPLYKIDVKR